MRVYSVSPAISVRTARSVRSSTLGVLVVVTVPVIWAASVRLTVRVVGSNETLPTTLSELGSGMGKLPSTSKSSTTRIVSPWANVAAPSMGATTLSPGTVNDRVRVPSENVYALSSVIAALSTPTIRSL